MKKIITLIVLILSGATGWILIEPTLSDDVVNDTPIVNQGSISLQTETQTNKQKLTTVDVQSTTIQETVQISPEQKVLSGSFTNGEPRYTATGDVYISGSDLSLVNLNSTNVPDGFVYLSNTLDISDAVRIEKLQGNIGNQNYTIPKTVDADEFKYVLIWCRAFSSLIGYAEINRNHQESDLPL